MNKIRHTFKVLLFTSLLVVGLSASAEEKLGTPVHTVLELFTSQGCSSCPPADMYLNKVSKVPGVLALSFHVDYWDYIGWKDPFATKETTNRQYAYVRKNDWKMYTPQIIVNGADNTVGSRRNTVNRMVLVSNKEKSLKVQPLVSVANDTIEIMLPKQGISSDAEVILVTYDLEKETGIRAGENSGKRLKNHNIVREIFNAGAYNGMSETKRYSKKRLGDCDAVAVIVQEKNQGKILGASQLIF